MRVVTPLRPAELQSYYDLRWRILRAPWKQPRGSERDALDDTSQHYMVLSEDEAVIAVARLHFNSLREAQIRYMAVATAHQRKGAGGLIMKTIEARARELGADRIVLDAREVALGFYRKCGYQPTGPGHVLYNQIAHVKMLKNLQ